MTSSREKDGRPKRRAVIPRYYHKGGSDVALGSKGQRMTEVELNAPGAVRDDYKQRSGTTMSTKNWRNHAKHRSRRCAEGRVNE